MGLCDTDLPAIPVRCSKTDTAEVITVAAGIVTPVCVCVCACVRMRMRVRVRVRVRERKCYCLLLLYHTAYIISIQL